MRDWLAKDVHNALKGKKLKDFSAASWMGSTALVALDFGFGRKTVGEYISAALSHELVVIAYSSPRTLRQLLGSKSYTSHMLSP